MNMVVVLEDQAEAMPGKQAIRIRQCPGSAVLVRQSHPPDSRRLPAVRHESAGSQAGEEN